MLPWSPYSKSTKMAEKDQDSNSKNTEDRGEDDREKEDAGDAIKPVATPKPKVTESSKSKSPKKTRAKSPSKDAKSKAKPTPKKKESSVEEDETDDEELLGILDQPLVIAGKRDRKSTDFLVNTFKPQSSERKKVDVPEGKGETLASMPRVQFQLNRIVADELKPLHRVLFGRAGTNNEVKRNIRLFCGFDFEKNSKDYVKKLDQVDRFTQDSLKRLCEILDVEKKGKKEDVLDRVMDFLMKPKASGNLLPETKKKTPQRKKSKSKRKQSTKEKSDSSKKKVEAASGSEDEDDEEQDEEEEEEKEPPPKKKKKKDSENEDKEKKEKKEKPAKKESKSSTKKDKKVVSIKISPGKKGKKREKAKKNDNSQESSDDEPLIKKTKKSPPTNDDIVDLVKELLDGADLEKITMKSVCKQVYDRFPDFDLSDRKEFIKESVKEIIT